MNRGWERIIGALPHIDMIIRVHQFLLGHSITTSNLRCPVANDLVDVHVTAGPTARLKDINRELVREFPLGNLKCGIK